MGCRQGIRYAIKSATSRAFSNCLLCSWWFCFFVRKARRQRVHATSFDWNWTKEEAPQLWGKQKILTQKISNSSFIYCRFRAPLCWTRLNGRYKMARWLRRASKKNLVGGVVLFWLTRNIAKEMPPSSGKALSAISQWNSVWTWRAVHGTTAATVIMKRI